MTTFHPLIDHPLPQFNSLLIKGPYPASSPLTLAISHLKHNDGRGDVVLLTPSRERFACALQEFNDAWLTSNALTGACIPYLSRIKI
jgi:hypothetical protein